MAMTMDLITLNESADTLAGFGDGFRALSLDDHESLSRYGGAPQVEGSSEKAPHLPALNYQSESRLPS
jgi:hypothetical protein